MSEFLLFYETDWEHMCNNECPEHDWAAGAERIWRQQGGVGDWETELNQCIVPANLATERKPDDHSWDRRAAYLVYCLLRSRGLTLNAASDLFA